MTAPAIEFLSSSTRRGTNRDAALLVESAARGDVQVRRERRWDVYLIHGVDRPEVRHLMVALLRDGVLQIADPHADVSLVVPSGDTQ